MTEENNISSSFNENCNNSSYLLRSRGDAVFRYPVVKLCRLSDKIVQQMCGRTARQQSQKHKMCSNKKKTEKRLIIEMEKILTEWVKNQAKKNSRHVRREKVLKKAKVILKRLKAESGNKNNDFKFKVTKRWFAKYRARAGWFDKYHVINPALFPRGCQKCRCFKNSNLSVELKTDIVTISSSESSTVGEESDSISVIEMRFKKSSEISELMSHLDLRTDNNEMNHDIEIEEVQKNNTVESSLQIPLSNLLMKTEVTNDDDGERNLDEKVVVPNLYSNNDSFVNCNAHSTVNVPGQEDVTDISTKLSSKFEKIPSSNVDSRLANLANFVECDNDPIWIFQKNLAKIVRQEKYTSQQIFNVQETVLFWKKRFTNPTLKIESIQGLPESKDPITLVLGTNASGDCKFQPVVVYSVENPSPIQHVIKSSLPLLWKFHPRAKVTVSLFEDWFMYGFIPSVQVYCMENKIPFKILLLLDSSQCHRTSLDFAHPNVKIVFMPPDIASKLQPISQGISDCFKLNYLKGLVEMAAENMELYGTNLEMFWDSFNILHAIKIISTAWNDVSKTNILAAWKMISTKISPKQRHVNILHDIKTSIIEHATRLKLNISQENIMDWLNYHLNELSNEELCVLETQSLEDSEAQMPRTTLSCDKLFEAFQYLDSAMNIFEMEDPNFKRSHFVRENIQKSYECYKAIYLEQKKIALIPDSLRASCDNMETGEANSDDNISFSEANLHPENSEFGDSNI